MTSEEESKKIRKTPLDRAQILIGRFEADKSKAMGGLHEIIRQLQEENAALRKERDALRDATKLKEMTDNIWGGPRGN